MCDHKLGRMLMQRRDGIGRRFPSLLSPLKHLRLPSRKFPFASSPATGPWHDPSPILSRRLPRVPRTRATMVETMVEPEKMSEFWKPNEKLNFSPFC